MTKEEMLKEVTFEVTQLRYELIQKGFNVFPIREVKLSTRCTRRFGQCEYHRDKHGEIVEVTINISDICFHNTENCLRDTILHELCHAMPNGQGHRAGFHNYAKKVARLYDDCHIDTHTTSQEDKLSKEFTKKVGRVRKSRPREKIRFCVICNGCGSKDYYKRETKLIRLLKTNQYKGTYFCCECNSHDFTLEVL